jgi:geranylgeranyl pyrophosphate synthase
MATRLRADYADWLRTLPQPPGLDREVEEFLTEVDRRLVPHLKKSLKYVPKVEPLNQGMRHQIMSGGKRIRAALCVCACELFSTPSLRGLDFAAAIEHMQNFTLVHDDIADGDEERRAQRSIWKQFGVPHGINIGDMFVPLAALAILEAPYADSLKIRLLEVVSHFGLEMVEGQSLDINMRGNEAVTVDDYLECTRKKTGAFLAMATVGGGIVGGGDDADLMKLRDFAVQAGVAFQIRDDMLDLEGTKGRAIGSDILEGKRTLLVIHAARNASKLQRKHLYGILDKPREQKTGRELTWVIDLYRRTNAHEYADLTSARIIDTACSHILDFPESVAKYRLLRISKYLSGRTH